MTCIPLNRLQRLTATNAFHTLAVVLGRMIEHTATPVE